jgi:hypothetical protein
MIILMKYRNILSWKIVLLQTFTLADFHSHQDNRRTLQRRDSVSHLTNYRGSVMEEDMRLPMFGWNLETLNMVVLPMVQTKLVNQYFIYDSCSSVCSVDRQQPD